MAPAALLIDDSSLARVRSAVVLLEQAIFTSARTSRQHGYQLVAASPGLCDEDAQAITLWAPSHDSLSTSGAGADSLNFHPLPSGAHCISLSKAIEGEYSARAGAQIYTQAFVIPLPLCRRFSDNSYAIYRALQAQGSFEVLASIPRELPAVRLLGRSAPFDSSAVLHALHYGDADLLGRLLVDLAAHESVALVGHPTPKRVLEALISLLPLPCRLQLSFTTGLKHSPRRPFQLTCLPPGDTDLRHLERSGALRPVLYPAICPAIRPTGWAAWVSECLAEQQLDRLAESLPLVAHLTDLSQLLAPLPADWSQPDKTGRLAGHNPITVSNQLLNRLTSALADPQSSDDAWTQWTELHALSLERRDAQTAGELIVRACHTLGRPGTSDPLWRDRIGTLLSQQFRFDRQMFDSTVEQLDQLAPADGKTLWLRLAREVRAHPLPTPAVAVAFHPPHHETQTMSEGSSRSADELIAALEADDVLHMADSPAAELAQALPSALAQLEELDDIVFEAIAGKPAAYARLQVLWPQLLAQLGPEHIEESKAQYLRHAMAVWQECQAETSDSPKQGMRALEVLCLLLGQ
jgi:hypothetical protein